MGYIGKAHQSTSVPARTVSMLTGDGTTTTLTLSQEPMSASNVSVFFDGVAQTPGTDFTLSGSQLTFTSAPPTACVVFAIVGGGENISSPMDGSITAESIVAGAITNAKIASVAASKLTGSAFPALDASNVTFAVQQNLFTKSAADPTETSNVSLGTIWVNTLSGEIFVCVSDVNNQNSFMNVGTGTTSVMGNVTPGEATDNVPDMTESTAMSHTFTGGTDADGTVTHYHVDQISDVNVLSVSAAEVAAGSPHVFTALPVSSDTDVTFRVRTKDDEGAYSNGITITITVSDYTIVGYQGSSYIYSSGGGLNYANPIEKFSITNEGDGTAVGSLVVPRGINGGCSSTTYGHTVGGRTAAVTTTNTIDRFSFSSDGNATNWGNLSTATGYNTTWTDWDVSGYNVGGLYGGYSMIQKFSFANTNPSVDTGANLQYGTTGISTHSDRVNSHGYGAAYYGESQQIQRYTFNSSSHTIGVGNLVRAYRIFGNGCQNDTHGYTVGGYGSNFTTPGRLEKFSFSSSSTSVDWGLMGEPNDAGGQNCCASGALYGYILGGADPMSGAPHHNIWKFSFSSSAAHVLIGGLTTVDRNNYSASNQY